MKNTNYLNKYMKILGVALVAFILAGSIPVQSAVSLTPAEIESLIPKLPTDFESITPLKDVIVGFQPGKYNSALLALQGGKIQADLSPLVPAIAVKVPESIIEKLQNNPSIKYIEEDFTAFALQNTDSNAEYASSWGVDHINADRVHLASSKNKGNGINVAVMDTGIDYKHPDLTANYKGGYDFVNKDFDPMDDNNHGTHVAGIIGAVKDGKGIVGVAPSVNLYGLKVLDSKGSGSYSNIVAALNWAVNNNMHIVSMSLGGPYSSITLSEAIKNANNKGVLLVAAAGNEGKSTIYYPAAYKEVIAVGATDKSNVKASFSNWGTKLEIAAPGVSVKSTIVGGGYASYSGTSMATPHVSGVAALVWSNGVATSNTSIRDQLDRTADDLGTIGKDMKYGYGLVDADGAVGVK